MEKKLLSVILPVFFIFLGSWSSFGQCPTSVSISAAPGTSICSGTSVTFTATPTGGANLTYNWFIGNISSQSSTSNTFTSTTLNNSDKIKVTVTSSDEAACSITSSVITMTVNPVLTPSVSISASKTTICPGENVTFNASPLNGGNNPSYIWKVNGTNSGTGNSFSTTSLTNGQSVTVELTSNATCASTTPVSSSPITINVKPGTPAAPGDITGSAEVCPGISSLTYSITAVANATSYEWTLPNGWSGSSTSNSISATSGATGSGTISVKAKNDCGTSTAQTFTVNVLDGTPNTPGAITGDAQVCPGISRTYSIAAVSGATTYNWTVPAGWSVTAGAGTNSITVTSGGAGQNGNVSVTAGNSCGTSAAKTLAVSVKAGTPAVPGTISGTGTICPGTTNTYSIAAVTNATSYEWILPSGWTGSSTTTSINATSNSTGGNITVKAINDCGTSAIQTLAINIKAGTPATPSAISGSNTVCPNTSETYTITNDATATEYIWTLPNGWTGTSTTSSITVNTGSSGSGNITVKAKNDCGTSAVAATIAVSVKAPAPVMSGTISGAATVCSGSSSLVYTIPAITNATSYIWTLPNAWPGTTNNTILTTTNSLTVQAGSSSGNISVIAKNSCGESSSSANFAISSTSGAPATPGSITTNLSANAICPPATGITFNIPTVAGATNYIWTLPSGWEITSGANTNAIVVRVNASAATTNNASVSVKAENICGQSTNSNISGIAVASHVVVNAGADILVCKISADININGTYSFGSSNSNLKPKWTSSGSGSFGSDSKESTTYLPSSADLSSGKVTLTLTTDAPSGACGPGKDELIITFRPDPTASISGTSTICAGNATDITFTATPNTIVTYKKNNGTDQTIAVGANGTAILNTGALTASTTYSLVSVKYATAPDCPKAVTGSAVVTITAKPTVTISYSGTPYNKCIATGQPPISFTGTGAYQGGGFSAPAGLSINSSTGEILPSASTAGTYTVTYTTLASGGCEPISTTTQVVIEDIPTITLSYSGTPFCSDNTSSPLPTLGGTGAYQSGSYSANAGLVINGTSGAISIAASTPGSYNIIYSVTPASGCTPITQTASVVITEKPQPSISYSAAEFCKSLSTAQPVSLTQSGTAVITGGTYSSLPSGLNIGPTSGAINPSLSVAGNYTIKYTLDAADGCEAVFTETTVIITEIPSAEISYSGPFCQSDASAKVVSFSNTVGAYQNGTFSGTAGLNINTSGEITPSSSQSGTHTITYKIPASGGCAEVVVTTEVTITPTPAATITYNGPFCSSESAPQAVTFSNTAGSYQNGTFSGTNGLSIDSDGNINPSTSTSGEHTVTYTIEATDGCEEVISTVKVEIFDQVVITSQPINVGICSTQSASFEVVASGDNLTYEWKRTDGATITNATGENTSKLIFNNATSTNAGEYFVEVSGNAACPSLATSETVTLNIDENIIIIKPLEDVTYCENELPEVTFEYEAHANGAELTFEWIKDNAVLTQGTKYTFTRTGPNVVDGVNGVYSGTITIKDLGVSDNGAYAVKIKGPDSFTCSEATTKTFTLSINDQPDAPETAPLTYCQGDVASALTATGTNLKWYQTETGDDLITGTPTPSTDAVGSTSYWVSQTPSECESPRAELVVLIKAKPAVPTTTTALSFCLNEAVTTPLEATGDSGNTINWYNAVDSTTPLGAAPTPDTSTDVTTNYWVSQIQDGCESDRVQVSITVNPLPILTANAADTTICFGTSTTLNATGATTYLWTVDGTAIEPAAESTKASPTVNPTATTTYLVTGTSDKGCKSTAEVTIQVDEPTVAGTISGPASVCISSPGGDLTLSGYTGDVVRWERSTDGGANWTSIQQTTATLNFTGLSETTTFRAFVKNGVCDELASNEVTVNIDPLPVGGELSFNAVGRLFTICQNAVGDYAEPLSLTGYTGEIVKWQYRSFDANSWSTLSIGGTPFTGTTLTADQIESFNFQKTTVFQVEIKSGACTPNALSKTAIISVIPSDITPSPVTVDPGVVCLGQEVTLSSETGYETGGTILDQGAFDNASITNHGWRIRRNNNSTDLGFDTDANNTEFDRWKRGTPRAFRTASTTSPYSTSGVLFDTGIESGNKGFGLVSGGNSSTMETPVFSIGATDQAILTFDQAYVLTPGSFIKVEISTDGGNTYQTLYIREVPTGATAGIGSGNYGSFGSGTPETRPENKIQIDLGNYLGFNNLRIRFNYKGTRPGDIWAVDNIDVPEGPRGITMEWRDYTDPAVTGGVFIGTNNSEKWTPTKIGLNVFEVKTKLVFNSKGDACEVEENAQRVDVFVFDKYTTTVTAELGSCGNNTAKLKATVKNASGTEFSVFPTPDGYKGKWVIEPTTGYTLIDSNTEDGIEAVNDPNATLSVNESLNEIGTFKASFVLEPSLKNQQGVLYENKDCKPVATAKEVKFQACIALDFDGVNDLADLGEGYTGDYSIEAWIRPFARLKPDGITYTDPTKGTIISTPQLEINMSDLNGLVSPNGRWYHIAVDSDGKLYIDGILNTSKTISKTGTARAFIGARWNEPKAENHFSGWIEEVRIWNGKISEKNIRFTMNQRLKADGNIGVVVDMAHPDAPSFGNLAGYYQLIATNILNGGYTPNLAGTLNGKLRNMETLQENTAPLPYTSNVAVTGQDWFTDNTWTNWAVWDAPNSLGIDGTTKIDWNIVKTSTNILSNNNNITVLGLISESNTLNMEGKNPSGWESGDGGSGSALTISHYLLLKGIIDLNGESQLLQPMLSIVDASSTGSLHRDQQGTANSYNYNYWSSPVSPGANNAAYTVAGVLRDGTTPETPGPIDFGIPYAHADGGPSNPRKISNYWISTFNGAVDQYGQWNFQYGSTAPIKVGEGFTMKGTSGDIALETAQNYTFVGIPNNGDVELEIGEEMNYLIGNPYPSTIDAREFIRDNLKDVNNGKNDKNLFDGTLYFWDHFGKKDSHILLEYVGGYAALNLIGGTPAITNDERVDHTAGNGEKEPNNFIPVGQAFFVNSASGRGYTITPGQIQFKNSQRFFKKEGSESVFLKPEEHVKSEKEPEIEKIRISYKSPLGYKRQILVGATPSATNGFDLGYDAPLFDYNKEDMYWIQDNNWLVIQGVAHFNEDQRLPLGIVLDKKGEFTIKIDKLENIEDGKNIYIRDILKDTIHNLTEAPFVATSEAGYINDRFEIIFYKKVLPIKPSPTGPLPGETPEGIELDVKHGHSIRELQILNPQQVDITNLYVYDLNGKLVETYYNIKNDKVVLLPVRNFSSGVYIIKLHAENQVISKKIIISN